MAVASTTNKGIILHGAPVAWIQTINPNTGAIAEIWRFDNLQSAQLKLIRGGAAAAGSNNIDINRSDSGVIRFQKNTLIINGVDESAVTEAATTNVDATGFGELILVTNQAPIAVGEALADNTWSEFINRLYANKDTLLLIAVPIGFTFASRYEAGTHEADGYYYLVCKLSSDIDMTANNTPMSLSLTFVSYKVSSSLDKGAFGTDATPTGIVRTNMINATWTDIGLKLGGSSTITLNPPALLQADADLLFAGNPVVKKDF